MATTTEPGASLIGASIRRKEDVRFITGKGRFTDDVTLPGQTFAAFVRSPHANATINGIDATAALALPGVHAVMTGEDMKAAGVNPIPPGWLHPGIKIAEFRALAVGRVSHVGNAVAVVIADSPHIAPMPRPRVRRLLRPPGGGRCGRGIGAGRTPGAPRRAW